MSLLLKDTTKRSGHGMYILCDALVNDALAYFAFVYKVIMVYSLSFLNITCWSCRIWHAHYKCMFSLIAIVCLPTNDVINVFKEFL